MGDPRDGVEGGGVGGGGGGGHLNWLRGLPWKEVEELSFITLLITRAEPEHNFDT